MGRYHEIWDSEPKRAPFCGAFPLFGFSHAPWLFSKHTLKIVVRSIGMLARKRNIRTLLGCDMGFWTQACAFLWCVSFVRLFARSLTIFKACFENSRGFNHNVHTKKEFPIAFGLWDVTMRYGILNPSVRLSAVRLLCSVFRTLLDYFQSVLWK